MFDHVKFVSQRLRGEQSVLSRGPRPARHSRCRGGVTGVRCRAQHKDNGAPGLRPHYHANYHATFVIGPDGHNIEVVCHKPVA
jgi:hypothetical protein